VGDLTAKGSKFSESVSPQPNVRADRKRSQRSEGDRNIFSGKATIEGANKREVTMFFRETMSEPPV
jgi:hypothetical protein